MFDTDSIKTEKNGGISCSSRCRNSAAADKIRSGFTGPVRQINMFADLYCDKNKLIIEAPSREILLKIMDILNHSVDWEE